MFRAFSAKPIEPQLQKWVDEIEAQSSGLTVLAARQFCYSVYQIPVEVTISEPRKFNVLEEFVLRAGIELDPPPTEDELATVLGLDSVFVRNITANLRALQTLESTPTIAVTPQGRQFYQQGSVPQPPTKVQIYAIADPLVGNLTFQFDSLNDIIFNQLDLANFVTLENRIPDISSLPLTELQQFIQASGLGLHAPESGKAIAACCVVTPTQTLWRTMSLFVIFDGLEDKLRLQVRRGKQILEEASRWLEELKVEGKIRLDALCDLSDDIIAKERAATLNQKNAEVEARLEKIRQQALETARIQRQQLQDLIPETGTAIQLRDGEIHQAFFDVLDRAQYQILIYSPWVSEAVVDNELLQLLQKAADRGVWILIGHGIARKQEDEDRPIPLEVEAKLRAIETPEGLSAVQIYWLGNSHAKEIIVDGKVHLCGSHNWLSYRGDWLPRGETVYKVTIPTQVQEARKFLAQRFQVRAQKLWDAAMLTRNPAQAEVPLCIWGALGMEEIALHQLEQHHFLELLPVWLRVVCQGLRLDLTPRLLNAVAAALSLLAEVSEQEPYIKELKAGWYQVMRAIAKRDRNTALTLLNDRAWSQFIRLGMTHTPKDSPEEFILRCP
ncbi:phospholipase D-like domain-containing protein [Chroococcidiopsis sp. TS-821]|uniref:phospholipase D-like domain-containing protein n=1 Tax=Chroococcidiopsis sp. TS-821 TaxID=1378066 RepID=UPI000CED8F42|nr:phospholipase D-like domain-containing protein [Chroococcidiopsis sp. TS-821]PPS40720.1 hypothetical protein B1A85_19810 [Chroococcidiopsis sp. TS-821]